MGWCLRGKEGHALLADGEIKFLADEQGPYVSLSPHFLKNHSEQVGSGGQHDQVGSGGQHDRQEPRRIYQLEQDNPHDGYNMMNFTCIAHTSLQDMKDVFICTPPKNSFSAGKRL